MMSNRDEKYWAKYYESGAAPDAPSNFAQYVMSKFLRSEQSLVELGCGNGRDARFFAENKVGVLAIDQCAPEIEEDARGTECDNPQYMVGDFTSLPDGERNQDVVYSRFTLHSVDAIGQKKALDWSHRNLRSGGLLCVETRGQKNELFNRGTPVVDEEDAFIYEDHYRRFVDFEDFKRDINQTGFTTLEASEKTGYAPFRDTDYQFIRLIAQKQY